MKKRHEALRTHRGHAADQRGVGGSRRRAQPTGGRQSHPEGYGCGAEWRYGWAARGSCLRVARVRVRMCIRVTDRCCW